MIQSDEMKHLSQQQKENIKKLRHPNAFCIRADADQDKEIVFSFHSSITRENLEATCMHMLKAIENEIEGYENF